MKNSSFGSFLAGNVVAGVEMTLLPPLSIPDPLSSLHRISSLHGGVCVGGVWVTLLIMLTSALLVSAVIFDD